MLDDKVNPPNWVDIAGLIISFLSLVAAGVAAWKLLARDKQREAEVDALIKMAIHFQKEGEVRNKIRLNNIRPSLALESETLIRTSTARLIFVNKGEEICAITFELIENVSCIKFNHSTIRFDDKIEEVATWFNNTRFTKGENFALEVLIQGDSYKFLIIIEDKDGNKYSHSIIGKILKFNFKQNHFVWCEPSTLIN
jgi:hypothetical protein